MSETRSAEQVVQEFKQVLGEEFGQLFYALHNDLVWLFVKWQEYQTLFVSKPERLETMNKTAPFILRIIQLALWENILLDIARLMDPPQSAGKDNLSVKRIPLFVLDKPKQDDINS